MRSCNDSINKLGVAIIPDRTERLGHIVEKKKDFADIDEDTIETNDTHPTNTDEGELLQ